MSYFTEWTGMRHGTPEPSDADALVWCLCNGWGITPAIAPDCPRFIGPGGSVHLPNDAMIDMRKDYAAAHPPAWTRRRVLAEFEGVNPHDLLSRFDALAREIATFRNAARDDGKWIDACAAAIHANYWKSDGTSIRNVFAIIRKHAPGRAT